MAGCRAARSIAARPPRRPGDEALEGWKNGHAGSIERTARARNVATAIGILRQRFGDRLQTGAEIRRQHANTITWIPNQPPDAVIWVENAEEVRTIVDVARTHRVPIIPFGAGTSLEGHINAPRGGFSVDFTRMNRIIAVNERDLDCRGGARRLAQAAQRLPARHGPVLPGRSRRRGSHHRRHGLHPRLGHHGRCATAPCARTC